MGALHAGHVSLLDIARRHAPDGVVASIFVNPTQFSPTEDLAKYPRPLEADLAKCEAAGAAMVFLPTPEEMYRPDLAKIQIRFPDLFNVLEGASRPDHFAGVCQVVAKLFNIVQPDVAVFGQKDFQQLRIISAMVEALDFPIQIVCGPTVREGDGLALSSRNMYLSPDERQRALAISQGLFAAAKQVEQGQRQAKALIDLIQRQLLEQRLAPDYVAAVDPLTLAPVQSVDRPTVLAIAARVGSTRLIDNVTVG